MAVLECGCCHQGQSDNIGTVLFQKGDYENSFTARKHLKFSSRRSAHIMYLLPTPKTISQLYMATWETKPNDCSSTERHMQSICKHLVCNIPKQRGLHPSFNDAHVSGADTKQNFGLVYGKVGNKTKQLQALGPEHPKPKEIAQYI